MAAVEKFDLCVIGAGPAGLAAAEKGLALGASVVIVEAVEMGGVAVNWGALPAQALSASARLAHDIRNAASLGVGADDPRINFARINAHVRAVIEAARPGISAERLAALGAEIVRSPAMFVSGSAIAAGERRIKARRFILATGSRPFIPEVPGLDTTPYFTPETIFEITRRPGHLIVVGGGATGTVLAQAHRRLGCEVSLIDMLTPLRGVDEEFSSIVTGRLAGEGIRIHTHTGIAEVSGDAEHVEITIRTGADEQVISGTHLLVATGRVSNLDTLDLARARVKTGPRGPDLNAVSRTSNRRIYCVGDAAGTRSVTAARHMGAVAAAHALGPGIALTFRPPVLPVLIATDPEIAAVGVTESEARARLKGNYTVTRFAFSGLDRARVRGRGEGHVKMITARNGRIIGATLLGECAGEIAAVFALAIAQRLTPFDLETLIAPYPALSEIVPLIGAEYAAHHARPPASRALAAVKGLLP